MPSRPLHRWKSFWLGLLVIAFFGWAWIRGKSHDDSGSFFIPGHAVGLANFTGHWGVFYHRWGGDYGGRWESLPRRSDSRLPIPFHASAWSKPFTPKGSVEHAHIFLAHWLLILLVLIPWTAFLFWRHRRMKRLAAGG